MPVWMAVIPLIAVVLAIIVIAAYRLMFGAQFSDRQDQWGQFGDFVGGVLNPMLAFFSILLLLITVRLQLEELQLTREELRKSSKALDEQSKAFARQNFESLLFNSIKRLQDFVEAVSVGMLQGKAAMNSAANFLRSNYITSLDIENEKPLVQLNFKETYDSYNFLAPFFRLLYHLFKLIDEEPNLSQRDRERYASLVRAQLDSTELQLLFYNGTHGEGKTGLMRYVLKYGLLKHIKEHDLLRVDHRELFYSPIAFQDAGTIAANQQQQAAH